MQFLAQSPSRDPIQTLQPQFISNISFSAPNPPDFRRAFFDRTQRSTESNYYPRSDVNFRCTTSRKRSRVEVKEDHLKSSIGRGFYHDKGLVDKKEMNSNDYLSEMRGSSIRISQTLSNTTLDSFCGVSRKAARITPISHGNVTKSPIDEFSWRLGVGWSSVSDTDQDVQAAVRGWSNFIENHFPISNVTIRLRSRGLGCFLVEANEGYYLFGDDLKQGKLVSTNLENVWTNLQGPVPVFEGETLNRSNVRSTICSQTEMRNGATSTTDIYNLNHFNHSVFQNQCF